MHRTASLLALAAVAATAPAAASQSPDSALVTVHVFDAARAPVADAQLVVTVGDSGILIARTDSAGRHILSLPVVAQPYRLAVLKLGYVSTKRLVRVSPHDSTSIDVTLVAVPADTTAVPLPAVKVQASRRRGPADTVRELERSGFYDRRFEGFAPQNAFITTEQIERRGITELKNLRLLTGRAVTGCSMYLNGAYLGLYVKDQKSGGNLNDILPADNLAGAEVYRNIEAPVMYPAHGRDSCVTLLWMK